MQEHVEMETSIPTWVDMFALSYIESKIWYNKLKCCLVADQDQTFFHIEPSSAMAGDGSSFTFIQGGVQERW